MSRFSELPQAEGMTNEDEGLDIINDPVASIQNSNTMEDNDTTELVVVQADGTQQRISSLAAPQSSNRHNHNRNVHTHLHLHNLQHHKLEPTSQDRKRYIFMTIIALLVVTILAVIVGAVQRSPPPPSSSSSSPFYSHQQAARPFFTNENHLQRDRNLLLGKIDSAKIRSFSREFARLPHLAGLERNTLLAHKTAQYFRDWGFDEVKEQVLPVTLTNVTFRAVTVLEVESQQQQQHSDGLAHARVVYECKLEEPRLPRDQITPGDDGDVTLVSNTGKGKEEANDGDDEFWRSVLPPMNGYSASGRAEGKIVWANWGRAEDFQKLDAMSVDLKGKIVVTRYGRIFRGNKVRLAQDRGASGVLIVHDPGVVGPRRTTSSSSSYPNGPWAANWTVQRGSISLLQGDPSTPGFPSQNDPAAPRFSNDDLYRDEKMEGNSLPKIPVQPLGYGDAIKVLSSGIGPSPNALPDDWKDTGFLSILAAGGIGPAAASTSNVVVRVEVQSKLETFHITNVMASITGAIEPDRVVLIGAHRDSWGNPGAVDPVSGCSTVLELARVLATHHRETGWRPRRTIQFNSWDAEEWSIIGSNEYVETNVELLRQRAVAYLNLDTAVSGNQVLRADGSPLLQDAFEAAAKEIEITDGSGGAGRGADDHDDGRGGGDKKTQQRKKRTLFSMMAAPPERGRNSSFSSPGAGTDHVGFYSLAGVPVLDASFCNEEGGKNDSYEAVYHSVADSVFWVEKFVDPEYGFHAAMAKLYLNILLRLSEPTVLPLNVERYAMSIQNWVNDFRHLDRQLQQQSQQPSQVDDEGETKNKLLLSSVDWSFMLRAVGCFLNSSRIHNKRLELISSTSSTTSSSSSSSSSLNATLVLGVRALNDISFGVERVFLGEQKKETGQPWFKHVIYTPSAVNSYGSSVMPMISVAISKATTADTTTTTTATATSNLSLEERKKNIEFAIGRVAQFVFRAGAFVNMSGVMPPDF